jgi:hypothetical protein
MPLQPIVVEQSFSQWGLDVVGMINPKYSKGNMYIPDNYRLFHEMAGSGGTKEG